MIGIHYFYFCACICKAIFDHDCHLLSFCEDTKNKENDHPQSFLSMQSCRNAAEEIGFLHGQNFLEKVEEFQEVFVHRKED